MPNLYQCRGCSTTLYGDYRAEEEVYNYELAGNYVLHAKLKKIALMIMMTMNNMKLSNNKDIQSYLRKLLRNTSFTIRKGKKHNFLERNNKKLCIPSTPSDYRSFQQFTHDVSKYLGH